MKTTKKKKKRQREKIQFRLPNCAFIASAARLGFFDLIEFYWCVFVFVVGRAQFRNSIADQERSTDKRRGEHTKKVAIKHSNKKAQMVVTTVVTL